MLKVLVLGIVEGFTEWLPISSTGHLILVEKIVQFKQPEEFVNMFKVIIQLGAILAVMVIVLSPAESVQPEEKTGPEAGHGSLWMKIVVACIPAAVLGLLLDDWMDAHLVQCLCGAATLIIYGVLFIVLENQNQYTDFPIQRSGPDFLSDRIFHRPVPGAFPGAGYLPFRFHHSGSHDPGLLP